MTFQNDENIKIDNMDVEYPFRNKDHRYDNYENLYKRIKICKSCFIIYSLAAKFFDESLKKTIRKE